ncbi:effector-associated constant component EACC1 [Streptomyces sp. 900105755]|uniref:effector-associated constant component EACC1 n=1 Tax=unclassified Streptomyces TaxID=2593676 RepID=UPI00089BC8C8|nr:hypothetical protein [Streptomyces sp. Ag109_O5-10]SED66535.1 hypothetical protein SAMN05216533_0224 [Streptomyces sp. Ag109_O5-10]
MAGSAGVTEVGLTVGGTDAGSHLPALRDWLASEDELRGNLRWLRSSPGPGEMGGALDVLVVALGSGGAGAVLAQSLATWLTGRRADVVVTVRLPEGQEVTVDVRRAADPQAVVREVTSLLDASRGRDA